jgi:uncharacterized membrane protein YsdA (DUF1294 family)
MPLWPIVLGWYATWSAWTLGAFWWDKRAAERGAWRVRERTLHVFELLGGWPGAFVAMRFIRHKNRKPAFWLITAAAALLHIAAWIAWATLLRK